MLVVGAKWNGEDLPTSFFSAVNMQAIIVVENQCQAREYAPPRLLHDVDGH